MKKSNKSKSFAHKYWKNFEELVLKLLKKKLGTENTYKIYSYKTPNQNDGGYDGIILIEQPNMWDEDLRRLYTILAEAKLRQNTSSDLPLSDFAKTLVVAINRNASEVYVYTNLHYSEETYRRTEKFSAATGLKVKLIDIFELCDELTESPEVQNGYSDVFIRHLFAGLNFHSKEKRIQYEQEPIFENTLPQLAGDSRNTLLMNTIDYLKEHSGIYIIKGIQGCGKKLFIKHILNALQKEYNCRLICLEKFTTIKGFFAYLLSLIWNIDEFTIWGLTKENIDEIMSYMPLQYNSERIKAVLLDILRDIPTEYDDRRDVLEEHLIEYLHYIFVPICQRKKQLFAFVGFDKCTENIFNFTHKFIRKFSSENVVILTELRTDEPHSQSYIDEWSKLNPNMKPIELLEFNYTEYTQYMHDNHPDIDIKEVDHLYGMCYPLPIYIENLLSVIINNDLKKLLSQDDLNITCLYNNEKFNDGMILYSMNGYFSNKDVFCKQLAYVIVFFDGELSFENIAQLGESYFDAIATLGNSIYFDIEKKCLLIHHILYLKAFKNETILNSYEYNDIMETLYNVIEDFELGSDIREIKKFEIAVALREEKYILQNWETICNRLIMQNDFSYAKQLLKNISNAVYLCMDEKMKLINFRMKCHLGLNEYNSLDMLELIRLGESLKNEADPLEWKLFCCLKAKYQFSRGDYQKIITLTNIYRNEDPALRYIRALSIKHIFGIDACLLSLERGKKRFLEDWHLRYSYLDHLHSKYEKIDVEKSWEYLIQIEPYYDKLNLEDQIHFQYNKIALELYKNGSLNPEVCQDLLCKAFENILPVEMGRIHNLLGQIYYLDNDLDAAISKFKMALEILNHNIHVTYIYVPSINLALLYDEQNNNLECVQYAIDTLNSLEKYKSEKIRTQFQVFDSHKIIEKECAAFILSMELLQKQSTEIYKQYLNKFPQYNPQKHSSLKLPSHYRLKGKFTFRC
ncbi:MAG: restriction endonuclease [Lachnospiraceae bacterium]|nr:restriction endonuclease [Lachnospiraceae bacterium]